jgi:hypothetical protein
MTHHLPRSLGALVLSVAAAAGCATDNDRLLDGGASLPDIGADFDIPRGPVTTPPDGSCPADAATLPDGACGATVLADGAVVGVDVPPTPPPPPCNEVSFSYTDAARDLGVALGLVAAWPATPERGARPPRAQAPTARGGSPRASSPAGGSSTSSSSTAPAGSPTPSNPERVDDGAGGQNSVIDVCGGPRR